MFYSHTLTGRKWSAKGFNGHLRVCVNLRTSLYNFNSASIELKFTHQHIATHAPLLYYKPPFAPQVIQLTLTSPGHTTLLRRWIQRCNNIVWPVDYNTIWITFCEFIHTHLILRTHCSCTVSGMVQLYVGVYPPMPLPRWLSLLYSVSLHSGGSTPWAGISTHSPYTPVDPSIGHLNAWCIKINDYICRNKAGKGGGWQKYRNLIDMWRDWISVNFGLQ